MGSEAQHDGRLVAHAEGIRVPLIFLQTWPEERDDFVPFLGAVGEDQPVFALLSPLPDVAAGLDTVDDWVSLLLPQVRALPVEPPYQLAGWSFGGVVALELARRLHDDGEPVSPVHLIDTWLPHPQARGVRGRVARRYRFLRRSSGSERVKYVRHVGRRLAERVHLRKPPPPEPHKPVDPRIRAIWVPYMKYEPRPSAVPAVLYAVDESIARHRGDASLGFAPWLTAGFELERLPGGHWSVWEQPHVSDLAAAIARHGPEEGSARPF